MKKIILLMISTIGYGIIAKAQTDHCAPVLPAFLVYFNHQAQSKIGFGIEAGMQGSESPFGFYAGYYTNKFGMNETKTNSVAEWRGSLYVKGAYRVTSFDSPIHLALTAAPEISVQTGFDSKIGGRIMLRVANKAAIGIEPQYSIKTRSASINFLAAF